MADLEIVRGGAELLDELRPLWLALRDHHATIAPDLGPIRDDDDSWSWRRAQYEGWLAEGDAFVLLARRTGRAAGYAFVRPHGRTSPTWQGERRMLNLETLSVAPAARGAGVGAALIARVRAAADSGGYDGIFLTAVVGNDDALRFYEREGFAPTFVTLRDTRRTP